MAMTLMVLKLSFINLFISDTDNEDKDTVMASVNR